ncbi:MAG: NfeD family protein [Lonepinella koalarum]|nr:NfeD family protein [Lonepinella koalarum]
MTWTLWHWLILGFGLLIAEIFMPGVFLLWWGIAGIITAGLTALFPQISLTIMAIGYAILSAILSLLWWKYQHNKDLADDKKSLLNQRDHAMLGQIGIVQEIADNGIGRGKFADTTWRIQGENLQPNDRIEVVSAIGITLIVEKRN